MGEGEVVQCSWACDGNRGCVDCAFCFSSLVGSGIYVHMNGWWSGSREVGLCDESSSYFEARGDV